MKLQMSHRPDINENEVIIQYNEMNEKTDRLAAYIRQYGVELTGVKNGARHLLQSEDIAYAESVDGKTFLYGREEMYESSENLRDLEKMLRGTTFLRISKSCLMNTSYLECVKPYPNRRLLACMKTGDRVIITRSYVNELRDKLLGREVQR